MKKFIKYLWIPLFIGCAWSSAGLAKDVTFVFGQGIPPYIIQDGENLSGLEVDIIRAALEQEGHRLNYLLVPLGGVPSAYQFKQVDAIHRTPSPKEIQLKGFRSDYVITYASSVIYMKNLGRTIQKMEDIAGLEVMGFRGAQYHQNYKPWVDYLLAHDGAYRENSNQEIQIEMLYRGRVQAIFADFWVAHYIAKSLLDKTPDLGSLDDLVNCLISPSRYTALFKDEALRDQFNNGLKKIREKKIVDAIYKSYNLKYQEPKDFEAIK